METTDIKEFRNRIGKAIRRLREEEGISSPFLARVLNVTQPTISRIERGITSIAAEKLCFLAKSFNRPLSFFVGEQSAVSVEEDDILRAGLVYYGARHLRSKRTIDVKQYYRTYADFLNAALSEADDPRFAAALAATLYSQAAAKKIPLAAILSKVTHERLAANLLFLIKLVIDAADSIDRPKSEKGSAVAILENLRSELGRGKEPDLLKLNTTAGVTPAYVGKFINAGFQHA